MSALTSTTGSVETYETSFSGSYDVHYLHIETRAEKCQRISNQYADAAVWAGLRGKSITAEAFAHLADVFAEFVWLYCHLDSMDLSIGHELASGFAASPAEEGSRS